MYMPNKRATENQRYNAERKAQAALMKRDVDRDAILTQLYQESFNRLQTEIDRFYIAYAGKEGLTKQEAMKKASEFDVTKFAEKAKKAVKEKDFSPGTNSWLRTYNLKMKVSRLELLKAELALEIQNLTSEVNEVFDKARREEYLAEFKRQAGILGISSKGANKRIQSVLGADFYGQNFSSRVWGSTGLQATLQRDVFASLNRVYTDMMGYKQEINRLSKKYQTSKENAKRLLKTEIARINADTQHAMLKANGFTHMIFVAEPGACDICGPLDKKAIPIDEVEKGVNMFPMHPNCRCSAYGHIKMDYKAGGSTLDEYELWDTTIETDDKKVYNQGMEGMYRKKTIDQSKMSKASQEQINRLSRKFRKRGGVFISDEDAIEYLDEKKAEAITLDPYTILKRDEISISALIEELEHAEQYLRNENDGTALSVAINELNAKRKSIEEKERYKLPKIEIDSVRKDIKYYEKEVERLTNENFKF
nr:MAG TPA: minor capsid protein [Caudoviricetes sp.]